MVSNEVKNLFLSYLCASSSCTKIGILEMKNKLVVL
nr:MAG TPA: hypothetical protein [Caudoviricetes sp.]